jgi:transposase
MKAYSADLRRKIVEAVTSGTPKAQVARTFGVGLSTVKRFAGKPLSSTGSSLPQAHFPTLRPLITSPSGD